MSVQKYYNDSWNYTLRISDPKHNVSDSNSDGMMICDVEDEEEKEEEKKSELDNDKNLNFEDDTMNDFGYRGVFIWNYSKIKNMIFSYADDISLGNILMQFVNKLKAARTSGDICTTIKGII